MIYSRTIMFIVLIACTPDVAGSWSAKAGAARPKLADLWMDGRRTTRPAVATRNFQGHIDALRERAAANPNDAATRRMLAEQLLTRTRFLGTFDDFDEVDRLTELGEEPTADDVMARASFLGAVHRFQEARALLDHAERLGAPAHQLERSRVVISLAVGDEPSQLVERAEALAAASPVYGPLTVLASVYAGAGRFEDADSTYRRALEAYRDVSPFALAWVSFTRGVMWGEAADRQDLAEALYRDAIRRLPQYVVANVHLSELADDDEAVRLLEGVLDTGDPEPAARLSERVEGARKTELVDRARARYEHLLSHHRQAFLDHGAEFYLIAGESETALELATENVQHRRNARAYVVAIGAAREADERETTCRLVTEAQPLAARHPVLAAEIEGVGCDH